MKVIYFLTHPGLNVSAPTFKSRDQYIRETDARNRASVCRGGSRGGAPPPPLKLEKI